MRRAFLLVLVVALLGTVVPSDAGASALAGGTATGQIGRRYFSPFLICDVYGPFQFNGVLPIGGGPQYIGNFRMSERSYCPEGQGIVPPLEVTGTSVAGQRIRGTCSGPIQRVIERYGVIIPVVNVVTFVSAEYVRIRLHCGLRINGGALKQLELHAQMRGDVDVCAGNCVPDFEITPRPLYAGTFLIL
jgi:hypothetical protein